MELGGVFLALQDYLRNTPGISTWDKKSTQSRRSHEDLIPGGSARKNVVFNVNLTSGFAFFAAFPPRKPRRIEIMLKNFPLTPGKINGKFRRSVGAHFPPTPISMPMLDDTLSCSCTRIKELASVVDFEPIGAANGMWNPLRMTRIFCGIGMGVGGNFVKISVNYSRGQ